MTALTLLPLAVLSSASIYSPAYIDPGAGSVALQWLLAGLAGAGVFLRLFWRRLKARFSAPPRSENPAERPDGEGAVEGTDGRPRPL